MQKSTKISLLLLGSSSICATYLTPKFNTLALTSKILDIALLITAAVCLIFLVFKSAQESYKYKRKEERKKRKKRKKIESATEERTLQSAQESYKYKRKEERKKRKKRKERKKIAAYAKGIQGDLQLLEKEKNILQKLKSFKIKEFYRGMAEAILCKFKSSIKTLKPTLQAIIDSHKTVEEEENTEANYNRDFGRGIETLLHEKFNEKGLFEGIKNDINNSLAVKQFTQGEMFLQLELDYVLMAYMDAIYKSRSVNFDTLGVLNPHGVFRYTQLTTNILTMLFYHKREETIAFIEQNIDVLKSKGLSYFYFICASKYLYLGPQGRAMSYGIVEKTNLDLTKELNKYKGLTEKNAALFNPADIMKKHLTCELNILSICNNNS